MKQKIKIMVRPAIIRSRRLWLLYFRYNDYLIEKIKMKYKAQWCSELKCWWVDYDEQFIQELKICNEISVLKSQHLYMSNTVFLNCKNYYLKNRFI